MSKRNELLKVIDYPIEDLENCIRPEGIFRS